MKPVLTRKKTLTLALVYSATAIAALIAALASFYLAPRPELDPAIEEIVPGNIQGFAARNKNKILLLGVDGASWKVMEPLLNEGRMPNMQRLIREGASGRLKSLPVMMSPRIWTTILTGQLPAKHGITDFLIEGSPPKSYHRKVAALWDMLGDMKSSAFIGFWATWPPEKFNGIMVSDYLGHRSDQDKSGEFSKKNKHLTSPPGFLNEIIEKGLLRRREDLKNEFYKKFTGGPVAEAEEEELFGAWLNVYATIYWQDIVFRDIAQYILTTYHPDLTAVYFQGIDSVQHLFWAYHEPGKFENIQPEPIERYGDIINEYNCLQDEWTGLLCAQADRDTTVIIVSDHGFKPKSLEIYQKNRKSPWYYLSGDHDTYGVITMAGPPIKKGYVIQNARVQDITPTILYLLGLPVSEDMDGRVLTGAITPAYKSSHPIYTVKHYPKLQDAKMQEGIPELDERMKDRLKALGYIR